MVLFFTILCGRNDKLGINRYKYIANEFSVVTNCYLLMWSATEGYTGVGSRIVPLLILGGAMIYDIKK